jgi:DnaJ-class molecular chaperone
VATTEEVKDAYRKLSKIYHPDIPQTGDSKIFERLTIFYKSLTDRF